jgi:hypothetical protein
MLQVLLLWDRLLGYDSLFLLPALAAAVIIFRAQVHYIYLMSMLLRNSSFTLAAFSHIPTRHPIHFTQAAHS